MKITKKDAFRQTESLFYIVIGAVNDIADRTRVDAAAEIKKQCKDRYILSLLNRTTRMYAAYERKMRMQLKDRYQLFLDLTDEIYTLIQPDITKLYFTFKTELDRHGIPNAAFLAQIETARTMIGYAVYMFDSFFRNGKQQHGYDFARYFLPARLQGIKSVWEDIANRLYGKNTPQIDFNGSPQCTMAVKVIERKMTGETIFNKAGATALNLNPEFMEMLTQEDIDELNQKIQ